MSAMYQNKRGLLLVHGAKSHRMYAYVCSSNRVEYNIVVVLIREYFTD